MEIKILCPCGAKFKFDVEPVNGHSPGPVHCPSCGRDSTEATNAIIRERLTPGAATPAAPPAPPAVPRISVSIPSAPAAPTPAAEGPNVAIPAIRIPAAPTSPAPATATPIQVSAPAVAAAPAMPPPPPKPAVAVVAAAAAPPPPSAAVGPKMTVMPVPTTSKPLTVKPPGEATVHQTPPSSAPANAAGDPKAPGSPKMAFMAAPTPGSGSALSVAGGQQHSPSAAQAPAPAHTQAPVSPPPIHPASAKMVQTKAPKSGGSFAMGVTGAVIGCIVGAGIWFFLTLNVVEGWRILAWVPGIVGGFGAVLLGKQQSEKLGMAAAIVAGVITILTQIAVISSLNDKYLTEASEQSYKQAMAIAKKAEAASTDAQVIELMDEDPKYNGLDGDAKSIRQAIGKAIEKAARAERIKSAKDGTLEEEDKEEIADYRKKRLPELVKLAKGDPSRTRYLEQERTRLQEEGDVLYPMRWISMGIWIFSSIEAAYLLGRGKKKE